MSAFALLRCKKSILAEDIAVRYVGTKQFCQLGPRRRRNWWEGTDSRNRNHSDRSFDYWLSGRPDRSCHTICFLSASWSTGNWSVQTTPDINSPGLKSWQLEYADRVQTGDKITIRSCLSICFSSTLCSQEHRLLFCTKTRGQSNLTKSASRGAFPG